MKTLTLRIPDDLLSKSRDHALHNGTTVSHLVRELLQRHLTGNEESVAQSVIDQTKRTAVSMKGDAWSREDAYDK